MLKFSPAISVKNIPTGKTKNNYILFPDNENQNLYYALADRPDFFLDSDGKPSFNMTWYFGGSAESGGICTMTLALPMPDMSRPDVRDPIAKAVTSDSVTRMVATKTFELCAAMKAGQTEQVAALKAGLGFNDATANAKLASFDPKRDWSQFLPAIDTIDVRPVPVTSGTVTVQAYANKDAYTSEKADVSTGQIQTTPSLVNDNAAVITFNLKDLGANLFWQGLGGPVLDPSRRPAGYDPVKGGDSVIAVTYEVSFEGMLPAAQAKVKLNKNVMAAIEIGYNKHRGTWGTNYEAVKRSAAFKDVSDQAIEITLPWAASQSDKSTVETTLSTWAATQLEAMVQAQLPGVKLEDLDVNGLHKKNIISEQSRVYKLNKAISLSKKPQGQLNMISKNVDVNDLSKYFHIIDLNEVPYFHADVVVRQPTDTEMSKRKVDRFVITQLSYAKEKLRDDMGKEVSVIEFVAPKAAKATDAKATGAKASNVPAAAQELPKKLKGTFSKTAPSKDLEYSYLVAYSDGTPSLQGSGALTGKDGRSVNYLDLGSVDLGVLCVTLDGKFLPWDIISSATAKLSYGDWEKQIVIPKDDEVTVVQPFGRTMDKPVSYQLTLTLATGAPFVDIVRQAPLTSGTTEIILGNPVGNAIYNVTASLNDVTKAQLRLQYVFKGSGPDLTFARVVTLDASKPSVSDPIWKVPGTHGTPSSFRVLKARLTTAAGTSDEVDLDDATVNDVTDTISLTIEPGKVSVF